MSLTVSNAAREQLIKMLDQSKTKYFRIAIQGGGCSGFQYSFDIPEEPEADDILINFDTGYFIVMDQQTSVMMDGSELDWKQEVMGSSLVIQNPNANHQCGCGKSFTCG